MKLRFALIVALAAAPAVSGCATPRTSPLNDPNNLYEYPTIDNTLIAATFSGGGMRATALAYGALKALKETTKKSEKESLLIDEVDFVSSVSGGSVIAAYWALKGTDGFENLKEHFLLKNVQSELIMTAVNPLTWLQLSMPSYSRIDLFRDYMEEELFKGATYKTLINDNKDSTRSNRPYLILNTTDMETGKVFSFTPDMFNFLCADLTKFKLADAVAASAAYPVLLTGLTIKNYRRGQEEDQSVALQQCREVFSSYGQGQEGSRAPELEDLEKLKQRLATAKRKTQDLELALAMATAAVKTTTEALNAATDEVGTAKKKEQDLELALEKAKKAVGTTTQALATATAKVKTTTEALATAPEETETTKRQDQALELALEEAKEAIKTTTEALNAAAEEAGTAKKKEQDLELALATATVEIKTTLQALTTAAATVGTKTQALKRATAEVKTTTRALAMAAEELGTAKKKEQDLELALEEAKKQVGNLTLQKLWLTLSRALSAQPHDYNETQYVQLLDGGIADNLGLTSLMQLLDHLKKPNKDQPKYIVVIVVNARADPENDYGKHDTPPYFIDTFFATIRAAIDSTSFVLIEQLEQLREALKLSNRESEMFIVDVSLDSINNDSCRRQFQKIDTSWSLNGQEVNALIDIGRALVFDSDKYKKFMKELGYEPSKTPVKTVYQLCRELNERSVVDTKRSNLHRSSP